MLTGSPTGEKQLTSLREILTSDNIDDVRLGIGIYEELTYWDQIRIYNTIMDNHYEMWNHVLFGLCWHGPSYINFGPLLKRPFNYYE